MPLDAIFNTLRKAALDEDHLATEAARLYLTFLYQNFEQLFEVVRLVRLRVAKNGISGFEDWETGLRLETQACVDEAAVFLEDLGSQGACPEGSLLLYAMNKAIWLF